MTKRDARGSGKEARKDCSRRLMLILLATTALTGTAGRSLAADWTGNSGSDWFTGGNWSASLVPDATVDAVIDAGAGKPVVVDEAGAVARGVLVGNATGTTGVLTVEGDGTLTTAGATGFNHFYIGDQGDGFLTIRDGGEVTSYFTIVGNGADASGSAIVSGAGSVWTVEDDLSVGWDGDGTIRVEDGGHLVTKDFSTIAGDPGSDSSVTVTGEGSLWNNTDTLLVGDGGKGSLRIDDKARYEGTDITVGDAVSTGPDYARGEGHLTVSDAEMELSASLSIGSPGAGFVTVEDGGKLGVGTYVYMAQSVLYDGTARRVGEGTLTVTGEDSEMTVTSWLRTRQGTAYINVLQGGVLTSGSTAFGYDDGGITYAVVSGTGSVWNVASLSVSDWTDTTSTLTVADGGKLVVGGGTGTLNVVANKAASQGTINIGAAASSLTAAAPGTIEAASVKFGPGTGKLVFNHTATDYIFAPKLIGNGSLLQVGGTTILDATSDAFTGTASVTGGTLRVNGSIENATTNVYARLGGIGTLGDTNIYSGGVHAPGNSIGEQKVIGDYVNHGALEIELEPGSADRVVVEGTVDITGAALRLVPLVNTGWPDSNSFLIIDNDGVDAVTGSFGSIVNTLAFFTPTVDYAAGTDSNDVVLSFTRNAMTFIDIAETPNQLAAAAGATDLGPGNPIFDAITFLSEDGARDAFDQISGEIHASLRGALFQDSRFVREAALDHAGGKGGERATGLWLQGFGSWADWQGDGNAADIDRSIGGLFLGADGTIGTNGQFGLLAGYSGSSFDLPGRASSASADSLHVAAYGGLTAGPATVRLGAAYSHHAIDTDRSPAFGDFADRLAADYDGDTAQVFGEAGYRFELPAGALEPFGGLAYVNMHADDFTEEGGEATLAGEGDDLDGVISTLGIRGEAAFRLGSMAARATGLVAWQHMFTDDVPTATLSFATSAPFAVAGVPIAEDVARLAAGIELDLSPTAQLRVGYDGQVGEAVTDHSLRAVAAWTF